MSFPKPDTHDSLDEDGSDREDRPMLLQHAESAAQPPVPRLQKLKVLVLVGIIAITFETGNATRAAPWFASLEESICQTTTQLNHTLDCTENKAVHVELAEILGVLQLLECLPILLLSGFYGSLADRIGRRAVLLLGYIGLIGSAAWTTAVLWFAPTIPVRYIWLGPLFTIVGGGPSVSISILMTSAADVVDPAQRATVYSFVHGTALTAVILGSFAASVMMSTTLGNFVPLGLGLSLMILAALIAIFLPDRVVPDHESVTTNTPQPAAAPSEREDIPAFEAMKLSMHNMWKMDGMLLALLAGFVSMLGQQVQVLTLQYFPTRLKLSIAEVRLHDYLLVRCSSWYSC
jgi:MFS family permease